MRLLRTTILPTVILILLIIIMVGCIDIPTWDHTILVATTKDFRTWAIEQQDGRAGHTVITLSKVEEMFGKPAFVSYNGKSIAYVMGTENGIEIWPLCFGGGFLHGQTQVLKLIFDDNNQLKRIVPLSQEATPPMYWAGTREFGGNSNSMSDAWQFT